MCGPVDVNASNVYVLHLLRASYFDIQGQTMDIVVVSAHHCF